MGKDENLEVENVVPTFRTVSLPTSSVEKTEVHNPKGMVFSPRSEEVIFRGKVQFRPHEEQFAQKKSVKPALNKDGQTIPYSHRADRVSIVLSTIAVITLVLVGSVILYNKYKVLSVVTTPRNTQMTQTSVSDAVALDHAAQDSFAIRMKEAKAAEQKINLPVANTGSAKIKEDSISPEAQIASMAKMMEEIRARQSNSSNPKEVSP